MGTATIRLKFTSLIKNRSKCCLEVIPEVSNIQNLDKLKWTRDGDSIEYIVPITYKILLKKLNSLKENHKLLQDYHSCVDLLRSSSFAYLYNAKGDILKHIVSEHQISRPITFITPQFEIVQSPKINKQSLITVETLKDQQNKTLTNDMNYNINKNEKRENDINCYELKHTASVSTLTLPREHQTSEVQQLSIAPVCKINTNERWALQDFTLSAVVKYQNGPKQDKRIKFKKHEAIFNPPTWNIPFHQHIFKNSDSFTKPYNIYRTSVRTHPKARIAHFKNAMEREILPIKIILQDLLTKCATLGLLNKSSSASIKQQCKNKIKPLDINLKCKQQQKPCNRVVYSIIFDE